MFECFHSLYGIFDEVLRVFLIVCKVTIQPVTKLWKSFQLSFAIYIKKSIERNLVLSRLLSESKSELL